MNGALTPRSHMHACCMEAQYILFKYWPYDLQLVLVSPASNIVDPHVAGLHFNKLKYIAS